MLSAQIGNDGLDGGAGQNTLFGGSGIDKFYFSDVATLQRHHRLCLW
ncbi:hypothetical protein [Rhizobium laguerreae]|nr:hypothetical protein [Rhizobium laguerreae]